MTSPNLSVCSIHKVLQTVSQSTNNTTIVVVAHMPLASAYLALVQHVHGNVPIEVQAIDVSADMLPAQVAQRIKNILGNQAGLILTDLLGATPHNCAAQACEVASNRRVISPVSAPLLLRAVNYRHLPLQLLYDKLTS